VNAFVKLFKNVPSPMTEFKLDFKVDVRPGFGESFVASFVAADESFGCVVGAFSGLAGVICLAGFTIGVLS
jgi:hypothetical protein